MQGMQEAWVQPLGREDPLEQKMATYSSILAWEIPWTEDLVGYSSCGHKRVWHNLVTKQQHICTVKAKGAILNDWKPLKSPNSQIPTKGKSCQLAFLRIVVPELLTFSAHNYKWKRNHPSSIYLPFEVINQVKLLDFQKKSYLSTDLKS